MNNNGTQQPERKVSGKKEYAFVQKLKTTVDKLKAGFKKFNYEAEFVKETKQEDKK